MFTEALQLQSFAVSFLPVGYSFRFVLVLTETIIFCKPEAVPFWELTLLQIQIAEFKSSQILCSCWKQRYTQRDYNEVFFVHPGTMIFVWSHCFVLKIEAFIKKETEAAMLFNITILSFSCLMLQGNPKCYLQSRYSSHGWEEILLKGEL